MHRFIDPQFENSIQNHVRIRSKHPMNHPKFNQTLIKIALGSFPEDKGLKGFVGTVKGPCWKVPTSQNAVKIEKKSGKFDVEKTSVLVYMFLLILYRLSFPKYLPNLQFSNPFLKKSIL